ncbi:MAG: hypothetical protein ABI999_10480 [Acidobacteriota bacterium]
MSKKTIAKILPFVILIGVVSVYVASCSIASMHDNGEVAADARSPFAPPRVTGKIDSKDITESSGIAASKCQPGVFWTHNDSDDDAYIFAINEKGDDLGTWHVQNSENLDWEDIAEFRDTSGKCFIYIGEIGDNQIRRPVHAIYRVAEPALSDKTAGTKIKDALTTEPADQLKFSYPDHNSNAETLMVHPTTGDIYVLTKRFDGPSGIYRIKPNFGSDSVTTAEKLGELAVPNVPNGYLTGGDIAPDGRHAVVCDYTAAYELALPPSSANFDDIWKQSPVTINRGELQQGEAVGYTNDGNSLILTSEKKHSPVVMIERQK